MPPVTDILELNDRSGYVHKECADTVFDEEEVRLMNEAPDALPVDAKCNICDSSLDTSPEGDEGEDAPA